MLWGPITDAIGVLPRGGWFAIYVLWIIGSTIFLLLHRRRPTTTLAWLLFFWTAPVLAPIGWFMIGPRRLRRVRERRQEAIDRAEVPAPADEGALPDDFVADAPFADLARVTRAGGMPGSMPMRATDIALYRDGDEAYPALLEAIREARETVHLEYYIWQPDVIGTRFRDALAERARAGVSVRLVVDAIGAKNCRDSFWQPLLSAGGEVRRFNPPKLLIPQPGKMNFRTHRKIAVLDGRRGFLGGINMSDDNRTLDYAPVAWRSTHLSLGGAPCRALQRIVLGDWLYGVPVGSKADEDEVDADLPGDIDRWFPDHQPCDGPWTQIVDSGPDEPTPDIQRLYFAAITRAERRVWLTTPYFVPDEPIETALDTAARRGVDVRLMIPAHSDSVMADAAGRTYTRPLLEAGARVFGFEPCMNHSKTLIVDDDFATIGTANFDNRSFRLNFEAVAAVFDRDINARLAELFVEDLERSTELHPDETPTRAERLIENAARLLSPLL